MFGHFIGLVLFLAVLAGSHFMIFLFMLFFEVDIIHLTTLGAFLDVTPTVAEMSCNLGFREVL